MEVYPVADRPSVKELVELGFDPGNLRQLQLRLVSIGHNPSLGQLGAVYTGEKRPPKAGEWYLSGAVPEAYRAPNDLSDEFHIADLVRIETKTIIEIVQRTDKVR